MLNNRAGLCEAGIEGESRGLAMKMLRIEPRGGDATAVSLPTQPVGHV
jgi:hypothetical protein